MSFFYKAVVQRQSVGFFAVCCLLIYQRAVANSAAIYFFLVPFVTLRLVGNMFGICIVIEYLNYILSVNFTNFEY